MHTIDQLGVVFPGGQPQAPAFIIFHVERAKNSATAVLRSWKKVLCLGSHPNAVIRGEIVRLAGQLRHEFRVSNF